ncbi:lytic transglycosylase domain-containing protein [Sphingomonas sp. KR1UV-12]|uniref:Lytic transglycosylase domain-containing protein n=1 Tax=Sphingomonas aurea TaxID=3063994 RepID=A0ABT9EML1_9SPHN|nr:lytic transglycosylase domain-containing protein [Sphingomonas sp. KR1UV-12]MDP1028199.1 lytic transglycosylase domain-containing protein [Sphingomonas sp. KR1UV-12]
MSINPIATSSIKSAIAYASNRTGVDFDYLLGQAKVESGLNASARAGSSSATGLFQFIESSWLAVVKKHGAEHGMGWAADAISQTSSGRYTVSSPALRQQILSLRNDPAAASLMAASHASDNGQAIGQALGRDATGTDLYMAHFLGLGGATKFLSAMEANPNTSGAALFPAAAHANRSVFYENDGSARSLGDIYRRFADKLGQGADSVAETKAANLSFAAQALAMGDDTTVVTGSNESASDALAWAQSTLGRLGGQQGAARASLMRPTPDTARLAYMMLARMAG